MQKPSWGVTFWIVSFVASVSAALTLMLAWLYPYGMNPDGHSYLDIADSWAEGRFGDAINGYWSALLPMLMAPLRWIGYGNTITFALVGAVITFSIVFFVYFLGKELNLHEWLVVSLCVVIGIRSALWAIEVWTPDLLFAAVGLLITLLGLRLGPDANLRSWFLFGLICGLLFLAKPAGMLTGISVAGLVWIIWSLSHIHKFGRLQLLRLGVMVVGWSVVSGTWILLLSLKYGYFTIGSSGAYNLALTDWDEWASPPTVRLFHPPHVNSLTAGTDPTFMDIHLPYSIMSEQGARLIQVNINGNLEKLWANHSAWIWVFMLSVIGFIALIVKKKRFLSKHAIVIGSVLIQTAVYLPVLFEDRYLSLSILLLSIGFLGIVAHVFGGYRYGSWISALSAIMVVFLMFPGSFTRVISAENPIDDSLQLIRYRHDRALMIQDIDSALAPHLQSCTRVASWSGEGQSHLATVQVLARANDTFVSGNMQFEWDADEVVSQFSEYHVDCLIVWNNSKIPAGLPPHLTMLSNTGDGWVTLYRFEP